MFEREEETVERVIQHLRRPIAIDPGLDARVMREIAQAPFQRRRARPLWPLVAAAAILATVLIARPWNRNAASKTDNLQFVLVAPQAASVALVGDFNDWDPVRSPMQTVHGVWATVVRLSPGRYRYAFLVNGVEWRADPSAPAVKDDEFGTPSSVVTVGGRGS
jgi:Glycogen recognition site of AMP-activated protein kinase